jgi:hypothetical protein
MAAASFVFAFTNSAARLSLTASLQQAASKRSIGRVMGVTRFASNLVSVALKALVGVAFAAGHAPSTAFAWLGAGLAVVSAVQFALARRLRS